MYFNHLINIINDEVLIITSTTITFIALYILSKIVEYYNFYIIGFKQLVINFLLKILSTLFFLIFLIISVIIVIYLIK